MEDKLTIVGPEPTDSKNTSPQKRVNIEALLLMARYNKNFRKKLINNRKAAIKESGLCLSQGEKLLLNSISNIKLEENIKEFRIKGVTKKSLPRWTKAMSVVLLISTLATSVISCPTVTRGVEPDEYAPRRLIERQLRYSHISAKGLISEEQKEMIKKMIKDTNTSSKDTEKKDL